LDSGLLPVPEEGFPLRMDGVGHPERAALWMTGIGCPESCPLWLTNMYAIQRASLDDQYSPSMEVPFAGSHLDWCSNKKYLEIDRHYSMLQGNNETSTRLDQAQLVAAQPPVDSRHF
jgi:hypothetical protein